MANSHENYAQNIPPGVIAYNKVVFERFGNFNHERGIFSAPKDAVYAFTFALNALIFPSDCGQISVYVNGNLQLELQAHSNDVGNCTFDDCSSLQLSSFWYLSLKHGDEVYLTNDCESSIYVNETWQICFMGMIIS